MVYRGINNNVHSSGSSSGLLMMLGLMAFCCMCFCVLSGGLYMFRDRLGMSGGDDAGSSQGDTADAAVTDAPATSNMDGAKLLTIGGFSMKVTGQCGSGKISFSESKNDKWLWNLKKAGDWNGVPYYTIESFYKNFNKACGSRFLTAPTGCKSPPFLSKAEFGPRQYWLLIGDATNGYQLRSLACAKSRFPSYMMQAGQKKNKLPTFSARSGSTFQVENENTA